MRIHVTGNAGAGKTTFAQRLADDLSLPFYSVDSVIWLPGWRQPPKDERNAAILALARKPAWVIEGVAPSLRRHADIVVVLDVPVPVCALRALQRCVRYGKASRPGFPEGCPEWKVAPTLTRIIFEFPKRAGATIFKDARRDPQKYRVLSWPTPPDRLIPDLLREARENMR